MKRTLKNLWETVKVLAVDTWFLIRIWWKNDTDFPKKPKAA